MEKKVYFGVYDSRSYLCGNYLSLAYARKVLRERGLHHIIKYVLYPNGSIQMKAFYFN